MPEIWVIRVIAIVAVCVGAWAVYDRITTWHDAYKELPVVKETLKKELECQVGSECDKKAAARASDAEQRVAVQSSVSLASALGREQATLQELAAWRARQQGARTADPSCAEWAMQPVRCPL